MWIQARRYPLQSTAPIEFVDLTEGIRSLLREALWRDGLLTITSAHTTAGIVINERDPALQRDQVAFLERLAPRDARYEHNAGTVDGRQNAHAHLLALTIPTSVQVLVDMFEPQLGKWQSIFFVELDGPRPDRTVTFAFQAVDPL